MSETTEKAKRATLVVGADSDMGAAIVAGLSGTVIAHYLTAPEKLDALEGCDRTLVRVRGDLSSVEGIRAFVAEVAALDYEIDKIVHLPSLPAVPTKFRNFDEARFEKEMNVAFLSAALVCREFVPQMAKRRFGRVVFMLTSYIIGVPPKFLTSYVAVKCALMGLMRSLATEYADKGVTVNGVAPSMTETKFLADLADLTVEINAKNNPLGRNARPDDIAPTVLHLLDDGNAFTSGAVIPITAATQF